MRFLFTCGGTAGHINPALGVAGRIGQLLPDAEFLFVGAKDHMEMELVPREGYPIREVTISGFQRSIKPQMILQNVRAVGRLFSACRLAKKYIEDFRPDVAVGTGGYVCYPVLRMAAKMGIPTAVHESNAVPGLTTKLLEGSVDRILVGLEDSRSCYKDPSKVEVTGTPVRVDFQGLDKAKARRELGLDENQPVVLAVFGSLGADYMNHAMEGFIRRMGSGADFRLIYATGKRYYEDVRRRLEADGVRGGNIDVREYIYDMPKVMTAADVIICRSGASTISELTYLGKPAVMVPSPNVVNHHQEKNARVLERAGAVKMLLEGQFDADALYDTVSGMLSDSAALERMRQASLGLGISDATDRIASIVLGLAQKGKSE